MDLVRLFLAPDVGDLAFEDALTEASPADVAALLALGANDDVDVRRKLAMGLDMLALHGDPHPALIDAALVLTTDPDIEARNWACFALAQQWRSVDTPAVRDALAARLDDIGREVRCEALVGLAHRRDARALERLREVLARPSGQLYALELDAASALGDASLHPLIMRHQTGWSDPVGMRAADVAARLTDPAGPGADLLDGVAEMSRRRAHGHPEGDVIPWWHLMSELLEFHPARAVEYFAEVADRLVDDERARRVLEGSALAQCAAEAAGRPWDDDGVSA